MMKSAIPSNSLLLALVATIVLSGQSVTSSAQTGAPATMPSAPKLDIDPTETIEITGWWTNDRQVLFVREDGAFFWWNQPNRFRAVSKSGRWDRQNYRTFWLEPYVDRKTPGVMPPRMRGAMRRTDGALRVDIDQLLNFRHLAEAPKAPEDSYVGRWSGPGGSLELKADGKYVLASAQMSDPAPLVARSEHAGTWTCDKQYIFLQAEGPGNDPVICTIVDRRDPVDANSPAPPKSFEALTTPIGELRLVAKVKDPKSAPAP
ncbi:MAG: hypothetical protein EXS01_03520 [Phycisphaerales bacterium]|nr:hypothetical protein [Phycisphaerales bacterium]